MAQIFRRTWSDSQKRSAIPEAAFHAECLLPAHNFRAPGAEAYTSFKCVNGYALDEERIRNNITHRRAFVVIRKFSFTCSRPLRPNCAPNSECVNRYRI